MIKEERADNIIRILKKYKYATVDFLVSELHYSPATIRRDITRLANSGMVTKSYGGVCINESSKPSIIREHENIKEKTMICHSAAALIKDNDTVFIDGTTTTYFMKDFLEGKKDITVVTSNLKLALEMGEKGINCYVTGGRIIDTHMLSGSCAVDTINKMTFDIGFFSVDSFSEDGEIGISESLVDITRTIIKRSKKTVCLCDRSKMNKPHFLAIETPDSIDCFISDIPMNEKLIKKYADTEFIVAK